MRWPSWRLRRRPKRHTLLPRDKRHVDPFLDRVGADFDEDVRYRADRILNQTAADTFDPEQVIDQALAERKQDQHKTARRLASVRCSST